MWVLRKSQAMCLLYDSFRWHSYGNMTIVGRPRLPLLLWRVLAQGFGRWAVTAVCMLRNRCRKVQGMGVP